MKIYFYGATKEEARIKCDKFWTDLMDGLSNPEKELKIRAISAVSFMSTNPKIPKDYRVHMYCDIDIN